jgi:hypothetical protein
MRFTPGVVVIIKFDAVRDHCKDKGYTMYKD